MSHRTSRAVSGRSPSRAFDPRPLPAGVAQRLRAQVDAAHAESPFSTLDPRASVRRVAALLADLPVHAVMYRGGLDLRGAEVDHVWLVVASGARGDDARADGEGDNASVLDVAFPLFADRFVDVLRRFVAGDAPAAELQAAADETAVADRVFGVFPEPMRYLGRPVWSAAG
jgi:hypothetical protein